MGRLVRSFTALGNMIDFSGHDRCFGVLDCIVIRLSDAGFKTGL
jgi:hypothetical protein